MEKFLEGPRAVYIKVRVQIRLVKNLGPIAAEPMGGQKEFSHPAVAAGQQGLQIGPLGNVGGDFDPFFLL